MKSEVVPPVCTPPSWTPMDETSAWRPAKGAAATTWGAAFTTSARPGSRSLRLRYFHQSPRTIQGLLATCIVLAPMTSI